ncbi:hypothetical protein AMECASPLE_026604 [Ameca splendens]|uniref:Uncharacterized protein n=1 Tax=Ameca splendens TaxID=208324 RepID=A0ABV0Z3T9_9TELE
MTCPQELPETRVSGNFFVAPYVKKNSQFIHTFGFSEGDFLQTGGCHCTHTMINLIIPLANRLIISSFLISMHSDICKHLFRNEWFSFQFFWVCGQINLNGYSVDCSSST